MTSGRFRSRFVALAAATVVVTAGMPAATAAADTTPPVLRSVALVGAAAVPGQDIPVTLDVSDDVGVVRGVVHIYQISSGTFRSVSFSGSPEGLAFHVDSTWGDSTYRLGSVSLYDAAGNSVVYDHSGFYRSTPDTGVKAHDVPFDGAGVVVSGGVDVTPPVLRSIELVSSPATRPGQQFEVRWSVADARSDIAHLDVDWQNQATGEDRFGIIEENPADVGSGMVSMPSGGPWVLSHVRVVDSSGVSAVYLRGGRLLYDGSGVEGTHTFDFSLLDMGVAPAAPTVTVVEKPGRLTLVLDTPARPGVVSGYRVTARPSGVTLSGQVGADAIDHIEIPDLPNGVGQTLTLVLTSPWGDSPPVTAAGTPHLSGNVTGVRDVTGDGRADVLAQIPGQTVGDARVLRYAGTGTGTLRAGVTFSPSFNPPCQRVGSIDVGGLATSEMLCQKDDLTAVDQSERVYKLGTRGWSRLRWVDGGFSLNADAYSDVIAVNPAGELLLYAKTSKDVLTAPTRIGTGWGSMLAVVSAGDLTGDRRNDLAAVDAAGRLWLYPGNGKGGLTARRQLGSGWQKMGALLPLFDFDRDGKADLGGITMGGDLRLYRGTGTGTLRGGVVIGTGWQRFL